MLQDIYTRSATQVYPIGMPYRRDNRRFRYCRIGDGTYGLAIANATQVRRAYGVHSAIKGTPTENSVTSAQTAIGGQTITITSIGAFTANYFQDGIIGFDGALYGYYFKIRSHPASGGAGEEIVFTLDGPVGVLVAAGNAVLLFPSPYADVRSPRQEAIEAVGNMLSGRAWFPGVPLVDGLAGEYIWVQTRGPAYLVSASGVDGVAVVDRQMMWNVDGSVTPLATSIGATQSHQIAGFLLPATQSALAPPQVGAASPSALDYLWLTCE